MELEQESLRQRKWKAGLLRIRHKSQALPPLLPSITSLTPREPGGGAEEEVVLGLSGKYGKKNNWQLAGVMAFDPSTQVWGWGSSGRISLILGLEAGGFL